MVTGEHVNMLHATPSQHSEYFITQTQHACPHFHTRYSRKIGMYLDSHSLKNKPQTNPISPGINRCASYCQVLCGCVTHDRESWLEGNGLYQAAAISLMPLSLYLLRLGLVTAPGADNGDQQKQGASGCSRDLEQQLYKQSHSHISISLNACLHCLQL